GQGRAELVHQTGPDLLFDHDLGVLVLFGEGVDQVLAGFVRSVRADEPNAHLGGAASAARTEREGSRGQGGDAADQLSFPTHRSSFLTGAERCAPPVVDGTFRPLPRAAGTMALPRAGSGPGAVPRCTATACPATRAAHVAAREGA